MRRAGKNVGRESCGKFLGIHETQRDTPRATRRFADYSARQAIADKSRNAFRGESKSPSMVPFDILGMVSY